MLNNTENQKLFQCMLQTMAHMSQSFLYIDKHENEPFYANNQAIENFADKDNLIDLKRIFHKEEMPDYLYDTVKEQLSKADYVMLHDIHVTDNKGVSHPSDVQIGYSNEEHTILFIEIFYI